MSTLVEELEIAALDADYIAARLESPTHRERARRLRRRAAWVRGLDPPPWADGNPVKLYARLTGPIPAAETAPTERTP